MKRFDMRVSLAVFFAAMIWGAVAHADVTGWAFEENFAAMPRHVRGLLVT